ncbi:MAG: glycosyltransferase [Bacteroidales bacterium]|jgi:glycosyltransferase involved in cell wall biosynthesis|nr:glycosyltransferase [Bacteroidales bacterium]
MKILHIIPSLRKGGAERLALDMCNGLAEVSGIVVKLICFSDSNDYQDLSAHQQVEVIPSGISLSLYKKNKFRIQELQGEIEKYAPDVIHTHLFEAEIISRCVHYPRAVWFSHCHDNMVQFESFSWKTLFSKKRLTNFYEKKFLLNRYKANGGTHFIAISEDARKYFEKTAPEYPLTLLNNAVDYKKFYRKKEITDGGGSLRLLNIGSFVSKKNQAFLLDVCRVLVQKKIDFELHLLGDGENRKALEEKAKTMRLEGRIFFHGNVDNVEEFLWNSDIYLHSATYEPFGLVLLEAMAAGLPVVTLDGRGNRDVMEQGKNGYMLFEPNAEAFAEKITELWRDKEKYREISRYAQMHAQKFDIKQYVTRLLEIYRKDDGNSGKKTHERKK